MPEEQRTPTEVAVKRDLAAWHPLSLGAYDLLHGFVMLNLEAKATRAERNKVLLPSVAAWVVSNVTDDQRFASEFEAISAIIHLIRSEFGAYWTLSLG